jgi:hypothetical protein
MNHKNQSLSRRIEQLESQKPGESLLETRLRRLADLLNTDFQALLRVVVKNRLEEYLSREMRDSGGITWPAFLVLRDAFHAETGGDFYMPPEAPIPPEQPAAWRGAR